MRPGAQIVRFRGPIVNCIHAGAANYGSTALA
jgi:hypothetical protein